MSNHAPIFTSSSATGSFSEIANATDSTALHQLSGTMNFRDSDHSDTHTTSATLHSAVLSSGWVIPAASLAAVSGLAPHRGREEHPRRPWHFRSDGADDAGSDPEE